MIYSPQKEARTPMPETDVIVLHGETIDLASNTGRELTADCTRAAENLITDDDLRAKWELSPSDLEKLTRNKALVKAIRSERVCQIPQATARIIGNVICGLIVAARPSPRPAMTAMRQSMRNPSMRAAMIASTGKLTSSARCSSTVNHSSLLPP